MLAHILSSLLSTPHISDPAYLDPGSGSYLLQILLAALLGSMFFLRSFWAKIINRFRKGSKGAAADAAADAETPEAMEAAQQDKPQE